MAKQNRLPGSAVPTTDHSPANPGEPGHDEWLIDESLEETFPASDATLPSRPGSTLATRNALEGGSSDERDVGEPRKQARPSRRNKAAQT